jgi:hypothetical protein
MLTLIYSPLSQTTLHQTTYHLSLRGVSLHVQVAGSLKVTYHVTRHHVDIVT